MKKLILAALLTVTYASAETWTVEGPFRDEFLGCQRVNTAQVQCLLKSTYIGSYPTYMGATYYAADTAAYAPDKRRFLAVKSSVGGRDVTRGNVNVNRNSSVTVAYTFDYPAQFDRITMLFIDGGIIKDVALTAGNGAPAATTPSPAPAPATVKTPAPAAPAVTLSNFDLKLTDCAPTGQGGFTCKGAELTPRR